MYNFYIDDFLCPIAPEKLNITIKNNNKTFSLINDGEINILKDPGLSDVSFSVLLPNQDYPFAVYADGFNSSDYYLNKLELLKTNKSNFRFIVTRDTFITNMLVSLESYTILEDAGDGTDVTVSINLKQYNDIKTKILTVINGVATVTETRSSQKVLPDYHVANGTETLWEICKKYLGDGEKYIDIAELNDISDVNNIVKGKVITFD